MTPTDVTPTLYILELLIKIKQSYASFDGFKGKSGANHKTVCQHKSINAEGIGTPSDFYGVNVI